MAEAAAEDEAGMIMAPLASLAGFRMERLLSEDARAKIVYVLGSFADRPGHMIVALERRHFDIGNLDRLFSEETPLSFVMQNDIYGQYAGITPPELSVVNVNVIYPATERHVQKYTQQATVMVSEAPLLYRAAVVSFIRSVPLERLQCLESALQFGCATVYYIVLNVLDGAHDYVMQRTCWKQVQELYCVGICHRRDVRSLRDLTAEHLPLLYNMKTKGAAALQDRYGVQPSQLRIYVHYQPSYYHFHVHFRHANANGGFGFAAGKAHLLDDVISNIELLPDYYQRCTLTYSLGQQDPLLQHIAAAAKELEESGGLGPHADPNDKFQVVGLDGARPSAPQYGVRPLWEMSETRFLIQLRSTLAKEFTTVKRNKALWEQIASRMAERGYHRTADQCHMKWKNLVARYKEAKNGKDRKVCPFYEEMEMCMNQKAALTAGHAFNGWAPAGTAQQAHYDTTPTKHDHNDMVQPAGPPPGSDALPSGAGHDDTPADAMDAVKMDEAGMLVDDGQGDGMEGDAAVTPSAAVLETPPGLDGKGVLNRSPQWTVAETTQLIALRAELRKDFNYVKRNKMLWQQIASRMQEKGYHRTAEQCKMKWKNLGAKYKEAKDNDQRCPFYDELDAYFNGRTMEAGEGAFADTDDDLSDGGSDAPNSLEELGDKQLQHHHAHPQQPRKRRRMVPDIAHVPELLAGLIETQQRSEQRWQEELARRDAKEREWREKEEERRMKDEQRADKRDELIAHLISKLAG
eukprot:jgi/Chlat1/5305/Chrsp35S05246